MTTQRLLPRLLASILAAAALALAAPAAAQSWPEKPVKLIVPFPAGGPIDTMARFVAQPLAARLGQPIVIENRPGGGGTIGTKSVAAAEPDGYTLLFGSSGTLAVAPSLYRHLDYDPQRAFVPVASTAILPHLLVVLPDLPARDRRRVRRLRQGPSRQAQLRRARWGRRRICSPPCSSTRPASRWSTSPTRARRPR